MRKQTLMLLSAGLLGLSAAAGEPQLVFETADGCRDVCKLSDVAKVNFTPDGLALSSLAEPTSRTYEFGKLLKVIFDHEGQYASVDELTGATVGELTVTPNPARDIIRISGAQGPVLRIYAADGTLATTVRDYSGARIDVSPLAPGLYIVTDGSASSRFFKTGK